MSCVVVNTGDVLAVLVIVIFAVLLVVVVVVVVVVLRRRRRRSILSRSWTLLSVSIFSGLLYTITHPNQRALTLMFGWRGGHPVCTNLAPDPRRFLCEQWRKSVVRGGGGRDQSGQAIKLFQAPWELSFTFHFWHQSFILDDVKFAELSINSFEWKNVTLYGVTTYSNPSYILSRGSRPP